jgi:hypothetical protein
VCIRHYFEHSSRYHHQTLKASPVSELVQPFYLNHTNKRCEVVYFHPYHVPYTQPLVTTKAELPPNWHFQQLNAVGKHFDKGNWHSQASLEQARPASSQHD